MNLDAFAGLLCRVARDQRSQLVGLRLRTAKGIGVQRPFYYLLPYLLHPENWKKRQISRVQPRTAPVWPGLAGVGLQSQRLLEAYQRAAARQFPVGAVSWTSW